MEKTIFFALSLLCSFLGVSGQVILDRHAVAGRDSVHVMSVDIAPPTNLNFMDSGSGVVWDFSTLGFQIRDTLVYLSPDSTPHGNLFPAANLAYRQSFTGDVVYLFVDSLGAATVGAYGDPAGLGAQYPSYLPDPGTFLEFPLAYGDIILDSARFLFTIPWTPIPTVDSGRFQIVTHGRMEVDGQGTLILPDTTSECLRITEYAVHFDSTWAHMGGNWVLVDDTVRLDTTITWWDNWQGHFLCSTELDSGHASYYNYQSEVSTAIQQHFELTPIQAFPNPARNTTRISGLPPETDRAVLYSLLGLPVRTFSLRPPSEILDLSQLVEGKYFLVVYNGSGQAIALARILHLE